jgi:hypothetical protein
LGSQIGVDWKGEEVMGTEEEASVALSGGDGELEVVMPMGKLLELAYPIRVGPMLSISHDANPHPVFTGDNLSSDDL